MKTETKRYTRKYLFRENIKTTVIKYWEEEEKKMKRNKHKIEKKKLKLKGKKKRLRLMSKQFFSFFFVEMLKSPGSFGRYLTLEVLLF